MTHNSRASESIDLAQLYERHAAPLRAYLVRIVGDPDVAEDLCHDTFLKALGSWQTRRDGGSIIGWLYRIARSTAYDELKRQRRLVLAPLDEAIELSSDVEVDQHAARMQALAGLPSYTREVLPLFGAGYQANEIAGMAGSTTSAVKRTIQHGRRFLRGSVATRGKV